MLYPFPISATIATGTERPVPPALCFRYNVHRFDGAMAESLQAIHIGIKRLGCIAKKKA